MWLCVLWRGVVWPIEPFSGSGTGGQAMDRGRRCIWVFLRSPAPPGCSKILVIVLTHDNISKRENDAPNSYKEICEEDDCCNIILG